MGSTHKSIYLLVESAEPVEWAQIWNPLSLPFPSQVNVGKLALGTCFLICKMELSICDVSHIVLSTQDPSQPHPIKVDFFPPLHAKLLVILKDPTEMLSVW